MKRTYGSIIALAIGAGLSAVAAAQGQKDWQAPDIGKFPARKNKPVDAAFAPYTPGYSAEQHKYGPWQPILEARERGVYPLK